MSDLASLEAEQQFLITSLTDLESEFVAGDLDEADYEELKADYTVRLARVTRQIRGAESAPAPTPGGGGRRWVWIAGLTLFGLLAGWLLAISTGERGVNDQITGEIELTARQQVFECQSMGVEGMLLESFECFDDVLARDPNYAPALAYRGWYGVLASGSAQDGGQTDAAAELLVAAGVNLDRAVEADPTYPDARAFRMVVLERLGRNDEACEDAAALADLNAADQIAQLTGPVIARLGC